MTVSLCHDLVKTLSEHIIYGIILLKCIWLSFRFGGSTIVRNFDWSIFWPVTLLFWNNLPVFCRFLTAYVWVCNCSNCIWLLQAYAFFKPVPVSGYQTKSSRCMFNYHHFLIMWRIIVRFRNKVQRSWNFKNGYTCDRLRCFYIGRYCIFTYNKSGEGIPKNSINKTILQNTDRTMTMLVSKVVITFVLLYGIYTFVAIAYELYIKKVENGWKSWFNFALLVAYLMTYVNSVANALLFLTMSKKSKEKITQFLNVFIFRKRFEQPRLRRQSTTCNKVSVIFLKA